MFAKRITGPVMMLLYQARFLTYSQIGILTSLVWLTDAVMELVGGAISDVYGRKAASLLYSFLGISCMAIFIFGNTFLSFAVANVLYGAALAIGSGNSSALLFDTLTAMGVENQFKKYRGRIHFPAKVFNGLILLSLPFFYLKNLKYPFVLGLSFYIIAFLTALFGIVEPPRLKTKEDPGIAKTISLALKEIRGKIKVILAIILQVLFTGYILLMFEYFQPVIALAGIPLAYFGLIYAMARLFEGLGGLLVYKVQGLGNKKLLVMNAILIIAALVGFAFARNLYLLFFILLICILDGVTDILVGDVINKNIEAKNRTTIMSFGNLCSSVFMAILFYLCGRAGDRFGVQGMFAWASLSLAILLVFPALKVGKLFIRHDSGLFFSHAHLSRHSD